MFNRSKVWAIGLLIAVFVAGIASGAALSSYLDASRHRSARSRRSYVEFLTREIGLSAAQRDSVAAVFERHRPEMDSIFRLVRPQMDSLRAEIAGEIRALLTPAQQVAYERFQERERAQRARRDSGLHARRHED